MNSKRIRGATHIGIAAAVSIAVLFVAIGAKIGSLSASTNVTALKPARAPSYLPISDSNKNAVPDWQEELANAGIEFATSTDESIDPLSYMSEAVADSLMSHYISAKQDGTYSTEKGSMIANAITNNLFKAPNTFTPHVQGDFSIDTNTSAARTEQYRLDMQEATKSLLVDSEPEFALFGRYLETNDPYWLDELGDAVERYKNAELLMLSVKVPEDAVVYHVRAVNAVGAYAHNLDRLIRFAHDSIAVLALLRAYNDVEREMILAFDALAQYYVRSHTVQE